MRRVRTITFEKIFLPAFIEALIEIYEKGADYIDITGTINRRQDELTIEVLPEYIRKSESLSGEDINDLLDGEE